MTSLASFEIWRSSTANNPTTLKAEADFLDKMYSLFTVLRMNLPHALNEYIQEKFKALE